MIEQLTLIYPELWLLVAACSILLIDLFISPKFKTVSFWLTIFALLVAIFFVMRLPIEEPQLLFSGAIIIDSAGLLLKLGLLICMLVVLIYSKHYLLRNNMLQVEYLFLCMLSLIGMLLLVSSANYLSMYLAMELLTFPLYTLVAMGHPRGQASESAFKYFVIGALSSSLFLFGVSLLYGLTGSLNFDPLLYQGTDFSGQVVNIAIIFLLAGVAFKFGAAPFHVWMPDVYAGANTPVTLLISSAPKIAAVGMAYRLFNDLLSSLYIEWSGLLLIMAVGSLVLGNIVAIIQTNLKRLLAYSAIGHMGFVLLGIISGGIVGYEVATYYTFIYTIIAVAAFAVIIALSKDSFECEGIADLHGLGKRQPFMAFIMLLIMFAFAGIPPTAGFYAKFLVISAAIDAGHVLLAVIAMLCSVIAAFYYLRLVKIMYFVKDQQLEQEGIVSIGKLATVILSVNSIAILALGIFPAPFHSLIVKSFNF